MTDPVIPASTDSLEKRHDKAIESGHAQCPKCEMGWLEYRIATDDWYCTQCSYSDRAPVLKAQWDITHDPAVQDKPDDASHNEYDGSLQSRRIDKPTP